MTNEELIKELEACLTDIAQYCRHAIEKRPEEIPKNTWDFVLSSIELRALRSFEMILKQKNKQ